MDWDDLRYFAALSRAGSLSEAARRLQVDHSTVARRITALEEHLGTRLFDRLPRGYALTAEGEALSDRVRRMEEEALGIERVARGSEAGLSGTVRLSASPTFASRFLAPRLGGLRARHPGIQLELIGDSRNANLTRREADLALRLAQPEGGTLVARRVADLGFGLYTAKGYDRPPADWELLGYDESLDHVPQQQWLHRLAEGRPLVLRSNDLSSLLSATQAGLGAAVLPCFLAEGDPSLVRHDTGPERPSRPLWLVVHDDLRRSPRVRAVMDFLVELLDESRALLEGAPPRG